MLIDQKRAHERILFEKYMTTLNTQKVTGQKSLFPEILELSAGDFMLVGEILADLEYLGFELNVFGKTVMPYMPPHRTYLIPGRRKC